MLGRSWPQERPIFRWIRVKTKGSRPARRDDHSVVVDDEPGTTECRSSQYWWDLMDQRARPVELSCLDPLGNAPIPIPKRVVRSLTVTMVASAGAWTCEVG